MKILRLQFKNLNSLYGEWEIDFTGRSFLNDGLFVLSGPTGAGKSTILDAVCLALYGQTPRLGKITQTSNEIMSKHTAACYSLLHFETKGIQYYARFDQRKAKNNPNGKLQDVERSIAKDSPTNIICRKKTDINEEIIRITGMDFSRFTRSILLAQGAFDSFLKAKDEEKSMLLEQITGTEIYSEISKAVFERAKLEKDKTRELTILTENMQLLSPEEIEDLQKKQAEQNIALTDINNELKQIQGTLVRLNQMQDLEAKINREEKYYTKLLEKKNNSLEQKIRLENAEKAEKLVPEYTMLMKQEKELHDLGNSLRDKEKSYPELEKNLQHLSEKFEEIQKKHRDQTEYYEKNSPLFEEIKKTDTILETQKQNLAARKEQIQQEEIEYQKFTAQLAQLTAEKNSLADNLAKNTAWIQENQHIENLKQELSAIKQKLAQLKTATENNRQTERKIHTQKEELTRQNANKNNLVQKQKELNEEIRVNKNKLETITNTVNALLNNSKVEDLQEQLSLLQENKILLEKIASLEEQRKNLQKGKPCPLCGSKEHPYITEENSIPRQKDIDINISTLEKRIKEIIHLQNEQEKIAERIINNEKQLAAITQHLEEFAKLVSEKEQAIHELQKEYQLMQDNHENQKQELEQQLVVFKIPAFDPQHAEEIFTQLQNTCLLWDKKMTEKQGLEQKLQEKTIELAGMTAKRDHSSKNMEQINQNLNKAQEEFNTLQAKREESFGKRNPVLEERNLQQQIKALEQEKENYRQQKEQKNHEITKIKEQISQLKTRIAEENTQAAENKNNFLQKMTGQGFSALEEFLNARLDQNKILELQTFFKNLEQDIEVVKKQLEENTKNLQEEKNKDLTQKSKQEIEDEENSFKEKQKELLIAQGDIKGKLEQNQKLMETNKENILKLEAQKQQEEKWDLLNALIGSADGKKFRTIAQAVTFEHVIRYANSKLQLLQQRYLLIQNEQNPLSLCVLDNYQGGEIRAIQNLSGGETFIVSLSLALGLAQMASQNVQVDSLFLDEGFGTLDEENLDTALSTLASIQQEGKLIGVISHIPLLKERITTQIDIIPNHNGKSILEGAGCKRISE